MLFLAEISPFGGEINFKYLVYILWNLLLNYALVGESDAPSGIKFWFIKIGGDTSLFKFLDEISFSFEKKKRSPGRNSTLLGMHLRPVRGEIAPFLLVKMRPFETKLQHFEVKLRPFW